MTSPWVPLALPLPQVCGLERRESLWGVPLIFPVKSIEMQKEEEKPKAFSQHPVTIAMEWAGEKGFHSVFFRFYF